MTKREIGNLRELIPEEWSSDWQHNQVLLQICSSSVFGDAPYSGVVRAAAKLAAHMLDHPATARSISVGEENVAPDPWLDLVFKSGKMQVRGEIDRKKKLYPGDYLAFLSPIPRSGDSTQDGIAKDAITTFRGLLTTVLGHTIAFPPVSEIQLPVTGEGHSFVSPTFEMHIGPTEHGLIAEEHVTELLERMTHHCPPEKRQRWLTAFKFVGSAAGIVDQTVRLTNTWIALEVACGGRGNAETALRRVTKQKFSKAYMRIKDGRDGLFHHGRAFHLSQSDELLMKAAIIESICECFNIADCVVIPDWVES